MTMRAAPGVLVIDGPLAQAIRTAEYPGCLSGLAPAHLLLAVRAPAREIFAKDTVDTRQKAQTSLSRTLGAL